MNIILLAFLQCKKGAEGAVDTELKRLVDASKQEEGCIAYELYQYKDEPGRYIIREKWENADALALHMDTPHYKYFVHIGPALLETPVDAKVLTRVI